MSLRFPKLDILSLLKMATKESSTAPFKEKEALVENISHENGPLPNLDLPEFLKKEGQGFYRSPANQIHLLSSFLMEEKNLKQFILKKRKKIPILTRKMKRKKNVSP